jgi:Plavaka transposase
VIPVIVSSDKTQLTLFRDKMAYPIYLTIGNIPKDIRWKPSHNAQLLVGYIPTTKLGGMNVKAARCRALANLFHSCMHSVLGPISSYGESGLPMMSGDGIWRRCHPIFAIFVSDYPEQALVTCTYNGRCPKCFVTAGQLGEHQTFPRRTQDAVLDTYQLAGGDNCTFHAACHEVGLKPVFRLFWQSFPLADIFLSITPDILHQMLQGVMKHLIGWLVSIFGAVAIDARCKAIPPSHKTMLFTKGIATLSRVSGHEHKKMCSILLGLIIDLPIPGGRDSSRVVKAVRALLDFLFLAQFPSQTSDTIRRLEDSLSVFHDNKQVFIDLEVRENFKIPKLHSLTHYAQSIQLFGTTDNYNTEQSERLHINFTKDAYRATNRKDEYSQMTVWLKRREKIKQHADSIEWRQ